MKKNIPLIVASALFSAFFIFFIFFHVNGIAQGRARLLKSPDIVDVTESIKTEFLVSTEDLPFEGDWTRPDFSADGWKEVKIPEYRVMKEPLFKEGNFAYYRIRIPAGVLRPLEHLRNQISFSPDVIMFAKYEVFVNGRIFAANSPKNYSEMLMVMPIKNYQDNLVAIKAKIKNGDSAITHRQKILIGKGSELSELYRLDYKGATVFPLIFILSIGSVLFIFTLIYFVVNVPRSFETFLIFGYCVFLEKLSTGDDISRFLNLNQIGYTFTVVNIGAAIFMVLFFFDVIGRKISRTSVLAGSGVLAAAGFAIIFDVLYSNHFFNFTFLLKFWNIVTVIILVAFLPKFLKNHRVLSAAIVVSVVLTLWSTYFSANVGLNLKAFGNLLIFFAVAYETFLLLRRDQDMLRDRERELFEQEKDVAIGKTAALLAHDVRRPLEQMRLVLDRVSSGETSPEFLEAAKRDVEFSLSSVNNQVTDIMNFSKNRSIVLDETSFYRILSSALKQVMTINPNVTIGLQYDFSAPVMILGDESRLSGVLTNLLSNAVEAIRDIGKKETGSITIRTLKEGSRFVFAITNDGPGIPEAVLGKIFNPLFTYGKENGTGLGLASVQRAIHDHGGSVSIENREHGVEYRVALTAGPGIDVPVMSEFLASSNDYSYSSSPKNKFEASEVLRVLLLDDDTQVFDYFNYLQSISEIKFSLTFSSSIEEVRVAVKARRFDLYVLDYDLSGQETGLDFYREKLNFLSDEVIIHSNRERSILAGLHCVHVQKPISVEQLNHALKVVNDSRPEILIVDDSELVRSAWKMFHGNHNARMAASPEEARLMIAGGFSPAICVVDYYFENNIQTGDQLAGDIRKLLPDTVILISSSVKWDIPGTFSIEKSAFEVRSFLHDKEKNF